MEASTYYSSSQEHSRSHSYTRGPSRWSAGTSAELRQSVNTSDRSMSNLAPSPQLLVSQEQQYQHQQQRRQRQQQQYQQQQEQEQEQSSYTTSHLVHRFPNSALSKRGSPAPSNSTDSSRFRSLNDSTSELKFSDSRPSLIATSSYLQEKLLKERKVESDRSSSRQSNEKMSSSVDLRGVQSSPGRALYDISRPKSSTDHLDGSKKKGVGLKEMEQVCDETLHNNKPTHTHTHIYIYIYTYTYTHTRILFYSSLIFLLTHC